MAYSTTSNSPAETSSEREPFYTIQPAELIVGPMYERFSIAEALHQQFVEAENNPVDDWTSNEFWEQEYPGDAPAYRMYMKEVHSALKESSAVRELRQASKEGYEITESMVQAVFRSYEAAVRTAARRLRETLSTKQLHDLKNAGRNELDWSYRHLLAEHATAEEDAPLKYSIEDFFLILNPKARKVQYMESNEILRTLRHSMSQASTDQLSRDVHTLREYEDRPQEFPAIGEVVASDDFASAQEQLT